MRTAAEADLALAWTTPAGWGARTLAEPMALLSDHAHCELRAASSAQTLLTRNPGRTQLLDRLAALAIEEMSHFRRVVALLVERGGTLGPSRANPYVEGLRRHAATTRTPEGAPLLDRLLVSALIERRSRERFELLEAEACDPELRRLYADLGPSEAGHGILFVDLAHAYHPPQAVEQRLGELSAFEGELVRSLPFAARIHSGPASPAPPTPPGPPAR